MEGGQKVGKALHSPVVADDDFELSDDELEFMLWKSDPEADPFEFVEVGPDEWVRNSDLVHVSRIPPDVKLAAAVEHSMRRVLEAMPRAPAAVTSTPTSSVYASPAEFALRLGVDRKTVDRQLASMTEGVHFLRIGRRVVIHVSAATDFLAGREPRETASQADLLSQFSAKARRR